MRPLGIVRPALRSSCLAPSSTPWQHTTARANSSENPAPTNGAGKPAAHEKAPSAESGKTGKKVLALGGIGMVAAGGLFYAWQSGSSQPVAVEPPSMESSVVSRSISVKKAKLKKDERRSEEAKLKKSSGEHGRGEPPPSATPPVVDEAALAAEYAAQEALLAAEIAAKEALLVAEIAAKEAAELSLARLEQARFAAVEKRSSAKKALSEAIESKNCVQLQAALASAQEANLGTCAETELAQSLTAQSLLLQEALRGSNLIASPAELRGLSGADAAAAELASSAEMTEDQLRNRVVELAGWVAAGRLHARGRLEEVLAMQLEVADERSLRSLEEGLKRLSADNDEVAEKDFEEMDASLHSLHNEAVTATRMEASRAAAEVLAASKASMDENTDDLIAAARSQYLEEVVGSAKGFQHVEDVVGSEAARIENFQARVGLSAAVLGLEEAIMAGRKCDKEFQNLQSAAGQADSFVSELFESLPEGCKAICREGDVPTEETIRKRLPSQLRNIATAAFLPPGGGMAAEIMAHLFRGTYFLGCEANSAASEDKATTEIQNNLSAISRVFQATESGTVRGELEEALLHLDAALTGRCREAASKCIADTRSALLLRQALWAAKARVWCLTALE